jgi:hypothetical protein
MYPSIEIRWFFKRVPPEILKWFDSHFSWNDNSDIFQLASKNERWDKYLMLDGYPKLSIKIHEGKIEVKTQDDSWSEARSANMTFGVIEKWIKWEVELKQKLIKPEDIFQTPKKFVAVKKSRLLVKYSIVNGRPEVIDGESENISEGCQVELTKIQIAKDTNYSFAFESFGEENTIYQNFEKVFEKVFKEMGSAKLSAKDSYSYPVFLKRKTQK